MRGSGRGGCAGAELAGWCQVLAGRTTHLPAGPVQLDEAALGAAGITPGAGVLSLKLEHHNARMLLWSPPQFCV